MDIYIYKILGCLAWAISQNNLQVGSPNSYVKAVETLHTRFRHQSDSGRSM